MAAALKLRRRIRRGTGRSIPAYLADGPQRLAADPSAGGPARAASVQPRKRTTVSLPATGVQQSSRVGLDDVRLASAPAGPQRAWRSDERGFGHSRPGLDILVMVPEGRPSTEIR